MKKWMFNIILLGILSILIVGCTTVGAVNLPDDLNNNGEQTENIPHENIEDTDKSNPINENKVNQDNNSNTNNEINNNNDQTDKVDKPINDTETNEKDNRYEDEEGIEKKDDSNIIESKIHYSGNVSKKLVALTFDDGPDSNHTLEILHILDKYDIKATFFVIGQNAEKYPETLKMIYEKGHEVGNHTWSHKYLPKISKQAVEDEILMTQNLIVETIGEYNPLLRPPYGALKKTGIEYANALGYNVVNWSVDTRDWAGTSKEQMMQYVRQQLTPGGIILMHNAKNTIELLPEMIDWIVEQEYEFCTASEILGL